MKGHGAVRAAAGEALRALAAERRLAGAVVAAGALALGAAVPVLAHLRLESLTPLHAAPGSLADPAAPTVDPAAWGIDWGPGLRSIGELRRAALMDLGTLLLLATLLVLAVALITVPALLLGRNLARRRELGVRRAVGATRRQLAAQLALEGGVLGSAGAALGLAIGGVGAVVFGSTLPELLRDGPSTSPLLPLVAAALVAASATLATAAPALRLSRRVVAAAPGGLRRAVEGAADAAFLLGAGQVAVLSLLLGIGALLLRDGGGVPDAKATHAALDTALVPVRLGEVAGADTFARLASWRALLGAVSDPDTGVSAALSGAGAAQGLGPEDVTVTECACAAGGMPMPFARFRARHQVVGPEFFRTLGLGVTAGREFEPADDPDSLPVAVVNGAFARRLAGETQPVGRRVRIAGAGFGARPYRIVGIVEGPPPIGAPEPAPFVYLSALQHPPRAAELALRGGLPAAAGADLVRRAAADLALAVSVGEPRTLGRILELEREPARWAGRVLLGLAALALVLALRGVAAAQRLEIRRRTTEIGLRRAVGATRGHVRRWALGRGLAIGATGIVAGLVLVAAAARALTAAGLAARGVDPGLLAGLAALLGAAAATAGARPAREAARLDPAAALAEED